MNFSKYIGLPYKHKGREFNGIDCYGMPHLIYKNELDVALPEFTNIRYNGTWYERDEHHIENNISDIWYIGEEVTKPYKPLDVLLFYSSPSKLVVNHCGVFIGDNKFIHIQENHKNGSEVARFSGFWESKLYKVIRRRDA